MSWKKSDRTSSSKESISGWYEIPLSEGTFRKIKKKYPTSFSGTSLVWGTYTACWTAKEFAINEVYYWINDSDILFTNISDTTLRSKSYEKILRWLKKEGFMDKEEEEKEVIFPLISTLDEEI